MSLKYRLIFILSLIMCVGFLSDTASAGKKYHYYSRNPQTYRSYSARSYLKKQNTYRPATYSYYQQRNYGKRKYGYTPREFMKKRTRYDNAISSYRFGYPYGYRFGVWGYPFYWGGSWRGYWGGYYGMPYQNYHYRPWYAPYSYGYSSSLYRPWYMRSPADQSRDSARRRALYGPIRPELMEAPKTPNPRAQHGPYRLEEELVQAHEPSAKAKPRTTPFIERPRKSKALQEY